jgi:hypothetical protein
MIESTVILYFSGSGNSRALALALAERLPGVRVAALLDRPGREALIRPAARIVFVFPVHFLAMPVVVHQELAGLNLVGKEVAAVASSGGDAGDALGQFCRVMEKRGARVVAVRHLPLADNSVVFRTPGQSGEGQGQLGRIGGPMARRSDGWRKVGP